MKKRAIVGTLHPVSSVIAVLLFSVLVGNSSHLAHPQEPGEASATGQASESGPLIGVTSSSQNPLQIAILHWYDANLTTQFTTASGPYGVAFDGASIWVCNNGNNNVTKLRGSDGKVLGTFTVGTQPNALAFDGTNIWVANGGTNNVTKLRASDGTTLGTFKSSGTFPAGVAFDGTNIWVTNNLSTNVTKMSESGSVLGTFSVGRTPPESPSMAPISG